MSTIGEIALALKVDGKDVKNQVKNHAKTAEKAWAPTLGKLAGLVAGAFSIKAIADFSASCIDLGSELSEVQNVVDTAFPSMNKQLDEFAKNAMTNFGMSETMAKRFTGTFGAMSQSFGFSEKEAYNMSTSLVQLAGDVASFYNLDPTESYTKMKSVFTGETEALKELGVVMTQSALDQFALANGFGKTTKEMTEQEKVSLRLAFVTKNLQMASGDFIKTQDSWANQTRVLSLRFDSLKASLGKGFIALFTPIIKGINNVLAWMQPLADSFANLMEMLTGTKQEVSKGILNDVGSGAGDLATNLENAGTSGEAAAKKIKRAFAGVDTINKLSFGDSSSESSSSNPSTTTPEIPNVSDAVQFPKATKEASIFETMLKGIGDEITRLLDLFTDGFNRGFSDIDFDGISADLQSIYSSFVSILTSEEITDSLSIWVDSFTSSLGEVTGALSNVAVQLVELFTGSVASYLEEQSGYLKDKFSSIFTINADSLDIVGNISIILADISTALTGENAQRIGSSFIGLFVTPFVEKWHLIEKAVNDVLDGIELILEENKTKLKTTIDSILSPLADVLDTLETSMEDTFSKIHEVYDTSIGPAIEDIASGLSDMLGSVLDLWNEYVAPVLDDFAEGFDDAWKNHVQPFVDGVIEGFGSVAELFGAIINDTLAPLVDWICNVFGPLVQPVLELIGDEINVVIGILADLGTIFIDTFNGLVDTLTALFKGDWKTMWTTAWNTIKNAFTKVGTWASGIWSKIKEPFVNVGKWFGDKFSNAWKNAKEGFSKVGTFFGGIWSKIKEPFVNVGKWFGEKFSGAWKLAKEGFDKVGTFFGGIWDKVTSPFSNIKTWFSTKFSNAWEAAKGGFSKVATWASDLWGKITAPFATIATWFKDKFTAAWKAVKDVFSKGGEIFTGIKDGIINGLKTVINGLIDGINWVIAKPFNALNDALRSIRDVDILGFKPFDWIEEISVPQIPKLAQGGYVKANQPQLAMIGDNKRYGEIVAPENKMLEMIKTALAMQKEQSSPDGLKEVIALLKRLIQVIAALSLSVDIDTKKLSIMLKQAEKDLAMLGG